MRAILHSSFLLRETPSVFCKPFLTFGIAGVVDSLSSNSLDNQANPLMLAAATVVSKKDSDQVLLGQPYEARNKARPSFTYGTDELVSVMSTTNMNFDIPQSAKEDDAKQDPVPDQHQPMLKYAPEVVDDYIRNFLLRNGMLRTLEMFECEWYERFRQRDDTVKAPLFLVPDNYVENAALLNRIEELEHSLQRHAELTTKTTKLWLQVKKDCEFHRTHHSRVVQEKNKLSKLLKQAHRHSEAVNPTMVELRQRYEAMLKSKTLLGLEKEKLEQRVRDLEGQLSQLESQQKPKERREDQAVKSGARRTCDGKGTTDRGKNVSAGGKPTQVLAGSASLSTHRSGEVHNTNASMSTHVHRGPVTLPDEPKPGTKIKSHASAPALTKSSSTTCQTATPAFVWPADHRPRRVQSSLPRYRSPETIPTTAGQGETPNDPHSQASPFIPPPPEWTCQFSFVAHTMPVSGISLHQRKPAVASCSDDGTWKLWTLPQGELILSGSHRNWVSSIAMHPTGTMVATGSGDKTVKLWDFATNRCAMTLAAHTDGVWGLDFQETGCLLASAALDCTTRVWDVEKGVCLHCLRGHVDGVNSVKWLPCTNLLCTGSGDKTLSIWDARMNYCASTLYGHRNAVRSVIPLLDLNRADSETALASCDAEGVVKVWDVRKMEARYSVSCAPGSANSLSVDGTGQYLAVAMDDGRIRMLSLPLEGCDKSRVQSGNGRNLGVRDLLGHEGSVQSVMFDPSTSSFLVSGGSDGTIRYWS